METDGNYARHPQRGRQHRGGARRHAAPAPPPRPSPGAERGLWERQGPWRRPRAIAAGDPPGPRLPSPPGPAPRRLRESVRPTLRIPREVPRGGAGGGGGARKGGQRAGPGRAGLPGSSTASRAAGTPGPNKGGSGGRAPRPGPPSAPNTRLCLRGLHAPPAEIADRLSSRPPRPRPPAPAPRPRPPARLRTHRMEVCGATAGTASSSRCMQRTVLRKHRQRLGHPAPGL